VIPRTIAPINKSWLTPSRAFKFNETTVGKIIKLSINEAVRILKFVPVPNIAVVILPIACIANKPKITEGISANNSMAILNGF